MLIAAGPETFQSGPSDCLRAPIVFGTGDWEGATGTLTCHDIGVSNDAEFVVELVRHHWTESVALEHRYTSNR